MTESLALLFALTNEIPTLSYTYPGWSLPVYAIMGSTPPGNYVLFVQNGLFQLTGGPG